MKTLRILVLAPGSNPDSLSTVLAGYAHSEALARLYSVTLVANGCHEEVLHRKPTPFLAIELIDTPWLDRIYSWIIQYVVKGDYGSHLLKAFRVVLEWKTLRHIRTRIMAGEFDVVLHLLPIISVLVGPINDGLPWPTGFSQADKPIPDPRA